VTATEHATGRDTLLTVVYALIAAVALVVTWYHNLAFLSGTSDPLNGGLAFWKATFANHASTSITIDIFLVCVTLFIWMVLESRRLKIRFVWAYIVGSLLVAVSVGLPLFLIARQRRMRAAGAPPAQ
jgi:hypothetical protein